jgi:hypothetical protein
VSENGVLTKRFERAQGTALVTLQGSSWTLSDGDSVTVGRSTGCDVNIGSATRGPEDLGVSRRAATISYVQGRIWVRNDSSSNKPVYVRPMGRPEHVLDRRGDAMTLPDTRIDVVIEGQVFEHRLMIELSGGEQAFLGDEPGTEPRTVGAIPLTAGEKRLVTAICWTLIRPSRGDRPRPASYREAAVRLGISAHNVRNRIDELRTRLLREFPIPGIVGADAKDNLAIYAVRTGTITSDDLDALDTPGPEQ